MASKDNMFSKTEGGAMLSSNGNAQPSFPDENIRHRESNMRAQNPVEMDEPNEDINEPLESDQDSELDEGGQDLDKKIVKAGTEKALQAAGVPSGISKELVDKADEEGKLDEVVKKIKKKKMQLALKIFLAVLPYLLLAIFVVFVASVFINLFGGIGSGNDSGAGTSSAVFDSVSDISPEDFDGLTTFKVYLNLNGPSYEYVDLKKEKNGKEVLDEEIDKISKIRSGAFSPSYYYYDFINSTNLKSLEDLIEDFGSESFKEEVKDFLNQGNIYKEAANQVCFLSYAGLVKDGKTYYQNKISKKEKLNSEDYEIAIQKIRNDECKNTDNIANEFEMEKLLAKIDFSSITNFEKTIVKLPSNLFKEIKENNVNSLNEILSNTTSDYEFNKETYEEFLNTYYFDKYFGENADIGSINKVDVVEGIMSEYFYLYEIIKGKMINHYYNPSSETFVIDTLGSLYGDSKCAALELYEPSSHEYITSQGIDTDDIHSVSDGEVISVTYTDEDFDYDSCVCKTVECENGNEVKIKFVYDEIEYIALYSNLAEIKVKVGDKVKKGDIIATEGSSSCNHTKKVIFKLVSESGINYNTSKLVQDCSSFISTVSVCNFQNLSVNLFDCNNQFIKSLSLYDYVKEEVYRNFKTGIDNEEFLKAVSLMTITNVLKEGNYKVGVTDLIIKNCNYKEISIKENDMNSLNRAVSKIMGETIMYGGKFANTKYSNTCTRTEKDKNANAVYNELCINEALKLSKTKKYDEILKIYYPNFYIYKNYCNDYASKVNAYSLDNNKTYLSNSSYSKKEIGKINETLIKKIENAKKGSRAATVEAARFLALGLDYKIPYKNGGKYFKIGFNSKWYEDGLDSSGFVSWALFNGEANIKKEMTAKELITNNVVGNLKISANLYKYYDKIQVGDFAYTTSKIGIIIGKNDGILYVASATYDKGLIVDEITYYGESSSNYTHIYFADDYYNGTGNLTAMW